MPKGTSSTASIKPGLWDLGPVCGLGGSTWAPLPQTWLGVILIIRRANADGALPPCPSPAASSAGINSLILQAALWGLIRGTDRLSHLPKVTRSRRQREICTLAIWLPCPSFLWSPYGTPPSHMSSSAPLVFKSAFIEHLLCAGTVLSTGLETTGPKDRDCLVC